VRRLAPALLAVGLTLAAWRAAPGLIEEFGYVPEHSETVTRKWHLEAHFDRRRFEWLPVPPQRLRIENVRGETVARLVGSPDEGSPVWRGWSVASSDAWCEIRWCGQIVELGLDAEEVLVPVGSVPPREPEPGEEYTPRDSLRLYPDPD